MNGGLKKENGNLSFLTDPHLVCLEKTDTHLTFCHFGNVLSYNSLNPDRTLEILRFLKTPKTNRQIASWKSKDKRAVKAEVLRLNDMNLIYSFEAAKAGRHFLGSPVLNHFVKNREALGGLSQIIEKTRIGIVDLGSAADELENALLSAGFKKVKKISMNSGDLKAQVVSSIDFFIVVGDVSHKLYFSKLSQILLAAKKHWMLVTLDPCGGTIGPTFGVSGGPCYDCIIDHSKRHFDHQYRRSEYIDLIEKRGNPVMDFSDRLLAKPIFSYVAVEALKALSRFARPMTFDGFFTFDLLNFKMDYDVVYPSPVCPVCS